jgi:sugar phosphate isomerase/epimerase
METEALATMAKEAKKAGVSIENVDASNVVKTLEDAADATEKFVDETLKTAPAIAKATKETKDYGKATERMAGEIREAAESERQYQEAQAKKEDFENRIKAFLGV